jgi:hypothetical protein
MARTKDYGVSHIGGIGFAGAPEHVQLSDFSTVNYVLTKPFAKRQQMLWSPERRNPQEAQRRKRE